MQRRNDPTKWADEWPLPGLSASGRAKIKAELLKAHAVYLRSNPGPFRHIAPIEQAFDAIAKILFDARLLTVEILERQLRLLVLESGIAGGWIWFSRDEARVELFPGYFGHATAWQRLAVSRFSTLCKAAIATWRSKLLETEVQVKIGAPIPKAEQALGDPSDRRRSFILPLLEQKGWSIFDWAIEAGVSHATAMDYLKGKTRPYASTLLKLARALDLKVQHLPR